MNTKLITGQVNSLCHEAARCEYDIESKKVYLWSNRRVKMLLDYSKNKAPGSGTKSNKKREIDKSFNMSIMHEICSYGSYKTLRSNIQCAFSTTREIKQLIILRYLLLVFNSIVGSDICFSLRNSRHPLTRAVSTYYFFGEVSKMNTKRKANSGIGLDTEQSSRGVLAIGRFWYHGNESTPPENAVAMSYASNLPYLIGQPPPSISWSVFSDNVKESIKYLVEERISPMILERLDESLVVLRHYLGWSLADVVVTKPRKALSPHPGWEQWPLDAVMEMNRSLQVLREYEFYSAVNTQLDARLAELTAQGIDVSAEVAQLKALRARVTAVMLL